MARLEHNKSPSHQTQRNKNQPGPRRRAESPTRSAHVDSQTHQLDQDANQYTLLVRTEAGIGSQFLITEPLGMQFLLTELLRGETRTMYSFHEADVIDGHDEHRERVLLQPRACRPSYRR